MNPVDAVSSVPRYTAPTPSRVGTDRDSNSSEPVAPAISVAGYVSPRVRFDRETELLVIEIRDIQNGEVEQSYPPKSTVEAYKRAARTGSPGLGVPADMYRTGEPSGTAEPEAPTSTPAPSSTSPQTPKQAE